MVFESFSRRPRFRRHRDTRPQPRPHGPGIVILLAAFYLALLMLLPLPSHYRGDERLYTDAALGMMHSGDYLTPTFSDGSERFHKPPLFYWMVVLCFKLFGVNLLSSRVASLAAGCLLVGATYALSHEIFKSKGRAMVSAAIMAFNLQLIYMSIRATPDAVLALFVTLSFCGFFGLIFMRRRSPLLFALAYLGAALAFMSKGLMGLLPVVFSIGFCLFHRRMEVRLRDLVSVRWVLAAVLLAGSWFGWVCFKHGGEALSVFFDDQLGSRPAASILHIPMNLAGYLLGTAWDLAPWLLLVGIALVYEQDLVRKFYEDNRDLCLFVAGWFALLLVVFSLANIFRVRYFLPVYPLFATLAGALVVDIVRQNKASLLIERYSALVVSIGSGVGLLTLLAGLFIDKRVVVFGLLILVAAGTVFRVSRYRAAVTTLTVVSLCGLLLFTANDLLCRPLFYTSPAPRIAQVIVSTQNGVTEIGALGLPAKYAAQVALFSRGRVVAKEVSDDASPKEWGQYPALILSGPQRMKLDLTGYRVEECGFAYKDWKVRDVWRMMTTRNKQGVIEGMKVPYYAAVKQDYL